jgi:hypothetical protein
MKTNPPGYWMREVAQACRVAAAQMIETADDLDAQAARIEQEALARADERVPDGTYGGAR